MCEEGAGEVREAASGSSSAQSSAGVWWQRAVGKAVAARWWHASARGSGAQAAAAADAPMGRAGLDRRGHTGAELQPRARTAGVESARRRR